MRCATNDVLPERRLSPINEIELASLVARLEQIDDELPPQHWLWSDVMRFDVPRLRAMLGPALVKVLDEERATGTD